jgi:hypothetical protein
LFRQSGAHEPERRCLPTRINPLAHGLRRWFALVAALPAATAFLQADSVTADEPVVFRPAPAPGPADNPLEGFVPYAGQGRMFPHSLEFGYLPLAALMTGPTNFDWATLETGRKQDAWLYLAARRQAGPSAMDRWRTAPIGGEIRPESWPCLWKTGGCEERQDFARCARETHATWLMDTSTSRPLTPEERLVFGRDGQPFHRRGPRETEEQALRIVQQLARRLGEGNFDHLVMSGDQEYGEGAGRP